MWKKTIQSLLICTGIGLCIGTSFASAGIHGAGEADLLASQQKENPFAGSWEGSFVNLTTGEGGVMEWTISARGRLVGSYLWDAGGAGNFVGVALSNGVLHVAAPGGGGGFVGQADIDEDGNMVVLAEDVDSGHLYLVELAPR